MTDRSAPAARPPHADRGRLHLLPQHPVGWWAVVLLLAAGLFAAGWGAVENVLHNNWLQVLLALVLGGAALGFGATATLAKRDRSVLVWLLLVVVVSELLVGLLFGLALLLSG